METVINKISKIEAAACKIMDEANEEKRQFAQGMEQKKADFDRELENTTSQKLNQLRREKEIELKERLSNVHEQENLKILHMEEHFKNHRDAYSNALFIQLTRGDL